MRSDLLADLIASLSKAEKRYFKLSTNLQKGNKKYIELFDALDKSLPVDKLEGGSKSQLPVLRNYLQNLVLRSIRGFHEEASMDIILRNALNEIELLFARKQYTLASRLLERAKKTAEHHERYAILFSLIDWEMRLNGPESSPHEQSEIDALHVEWKEALRRYEEIRHLRKIYDDSYFHTMHKGLARDKASEEEYHSIVADPLLQGDPKQLTFLGQVIYHLIYGRYYHAIGKLQEDTKASKQVLALFDAQPERIIDAEPYYHRAVLFRLNDAMRDDEYDVAYQMIDRMRKNKYAHNIEQNLAIALLMEFGLLQSIGMFEEAHKLTPQLIELRYGILAKRSRYSLAILDDQIARQYFAMKDFEKSIEWSNKVLYEKGGLTGQNLQSTLRILVLMAHFELKNYSYLKYATKSAYQYLYRHQRLHAIEKRLINFFASAGAHTTTANFEQLERDLNELRSGEYGQVAIDYSDLMQWLRGRIDGTSYADVVRNDPGNLAWIKKLTKGKKKAG